MKYSANFPLTIRRNLCIIIEAAENAGKLKKRRIKEMGKYLIKKTKTGIKFDLKAGNGEVIATSEVYTTEKACRAGIASVQKNAPVAALEDQTVEGFEKQPCPKFEVYVDKAGEFRFRLLAKNGQNIAASEGYTAKKSCLNGIESVRKNAVDSEVVQEEE